MYADIFPDGPPKIVVLVGPTAVGKSRVALDLAGEFVGDIVSADSRQIYRYMDVGTAKPSMRERTLVPHFMLDLIAPDEMYSVQRFRTEALKVLRRSAATARVAFVVGGTGFYIQALLDRTTLPPVVPNESLRTLLRAEAEAHGSRYLHERLSRLDPRSSARIHPNNLPRLVRALEVVDALGAPVPASQPVQSLPALYIGLSQERHDLYRAADERVITQVESGLLDETRTILAMGYDPLSPALQGFGYREMVDHLQGEISLDQAIAQYQGATRRYIRRQMTWFGRDKRIHWRDAGDALSSCRRLVREWLATV
ncbi:MAG: tRNA (adenosine(37)-N6)-dimethylallyltransferase MiaA [Chloroflexota bacterium]